MTGYDLGLGDCEWSALRRLENNEALRREHPTHINISRDTDARASARCGVPHFDRQAFVCVLGSLCSDLVLASTKHGPNLSLAENNVLIPSLTRFVAFLNGTNRFASFSIPSLSCISVDANGGNLVKAPPASRYVVTPRRCYLEYGIDSEDGQMLTPRRTSELLADRIRLLKDLKEGKVTPRERERNKHHVPPPPLPPRSRGPGTPRVMCLMELVYVPLHLCVFFPF